MLISKNKIGGLAENQYYVFLSQAIIPFITLLINPGWLTKIIVRNMTIKKGDKCVLT